MSLYALIPQFFLLAVAYAMVSMMSVYNVVEFSYRLTLIPDALQPARVLMAKFRGKLLAMLQSALARGELVLPDAISLQQMQTCCNRLGRTKWNVHLRERYGHGNGVMRYLARYVRGGPMHSDQVTLLGRDRITLRYTPHTDSGTACRSSVMMLSPDGFLRRYLQHVPEPRKHTVRSYGLYAPRKSNALNRARATFRQAPVAPIPVLTWQAYYVKYAAQPVAHACPVCGGVVGNVRRIAPHHDPPRHCAPLKSTHA